MKFNQVIQGDIREIARQLPDQCVHSIVTSPPYWGLRDYGTAIWIGGNSNCDHRPRRKKTTSSKLSGISSHYCDHYHEGFTGDKCLKCGAIRQDNQIGLESTFDEYINTMVDIFQELRRVLRDDGTLWLNLGDSYGSIGGEGSKQNNTLPQIKNLNKNTGLRPKNLLGIPWRVALALQDDGWYLRSDIIWSKPNPMPESVKDRPSKSHEYIFLLTKSPRYFYDADAIREPFKDESIARLARGVSENHKNINGALGQPAHSMNQPRPNRNQSTTFKRNGSKREQAIPGQSNGTHRPDREDTEYNPNGRNRRTVWEIATRPYPEAHFAVFPPDLIKPCVLAGCPEKVCAECGAPYIKIIEKGFTNHDGNTNSNYEEGTTANRLARLRQAARENGGEYINTNHMVGEEPTCKCGAGTIVGGVVLDPFMGSGTTAQVAIELRRRWLGIELNSEFIDLTNHRISNIQPMLIPSL